MRISARLFKPSINSWRERRKGNGIESYVPEAFIISEIFCVGLSGAHRLPEVDPHTVSTWIEKDVEIDVCKRIVTFRVETDTARTF